jgi:HEPN domain-containing protein
MMAARRVPWDIVSFHAQQAAEKTLKALLIYHGQSPQRTHDCTILLTDCLQYAPSLGALRRDCSRVSRYGVAPRYPDATINPTKRQAIAAVAAMNRIRYAVLLLIPK